jgi:hypothetical protein
MQHQIHITLFNRSSSVSPNGGNPNGGAPQNPSYSQSSKSSKTEDHGGNTLPPEVTAKGYSSGASIRQTGSNYSGN